MAQPREGAEIWRGSREATSKDPGKFDLSMPKRRGHAKGGTVHKAKDKERISLKDYLVVLASYLTKVSSNVNDDNNDPQHEESVPLRDRIEAADDLLRSLEDVPQTTGNASRAIRNLWKEAKAIEIFLIRMQHEANDREAALAAQQAESMRTQLVLITVATILLPLSFFTSFYSLSSDQNQFRPRSFVSYCIIGTAVWFAISGAVSIGIFRRRSRQPATLVRKYQRIRASELPSLSFVDRLKEMVETILECRVCWWPFTDGFRSLAPNHERIIWAWCGVTLYVDVPTSDAAVWWDAHPMERAPVVSPLETSDNLAEFVALKDALERRMASDKSMTDAAIGRSLPSGTRSVEVDGIAQETQTSVPVHTHLGDKMSRSPPQQVDRSPTLQSHSTDGSSPSSWSSGPSQTEGGTHNRVATGTGVKARHPTREMGSERVYWCVDSCWRQPMVTSMTHTNVAQFRDADLFLWLHRQFKRLRGWRQLFSLKCCVDVHFIQFGFVGCNQHEVVCQKGESLPPIPPSSAEQRYEYHLRITEMIDRRIASRQIVQGMLNPSLTVNQTGTLDMVPKHLDSVTDRIWSAYDMAWGIHAVEGLALWKILCWMGALTTLGLIFVVSWLVFVDKTDLQNAFTVPMFLISMIGVALGMPQLMNIA